MKRIGLEKKGETKEETGEKSAEPLSQISYDAIEDGYIAPVKTQTAREAGLKARSFSKSFRSYSGRGSGSSGKIGSADTDAKLASEPEKPEGLSANYAFSSQESQRYETTTGTGLGRFLEGDGIGILEDVLSGHYGRKCLVTSVKSLPVTRKSIKEVRFMMDNYLSKVWVFKADPETTSKEMIAYEIAHRHGIPTGVPIGFMPKYDQLYPYDIAIIGGVVEHSRESFREVVEGLKLKPALIFSIAQVMAETISKYQSILTTHKEEFIERGVSLVPFVPDAPLEDRLFKGLGLQADDTLIEMTVELYAMQKNRLVVSQNDLNPGNILPIAQLNSSTGQVDTNLGQFGVIDWGLICLDSPFADPADFWVYIDRLAGKKPELDFTKFIESYAESAGSALGIRDIKDGYIQLALRQIYKIADPIRKPGKETNAKMRHHYFRAMEALDALKFHGANAGRISSRLAEIVEPRL